MFIHRRIIYEYAKYKSYTDYLYPLGFALVSYYVYEPNSMSFLVPLALFFFVFFTLRWHIKLNSQERYGSCLICNVLNVFLRGVGSAILLLTIGLPFVFLYMSAFGVFTQSVVESWHETMSLAYGTLMLAIAVAGIWLTFRGHMSDLRLATKQSDDEREDYVAGKAARTFAFGMFALILSIVLHFFGLVSFSFTIGSVVGLVISLVMFPMVVAIGLIKGISLAGSAEGELVCSSLRLAHQSGILDFEYLWRALLHFLKLPSEHPELFKVIFGAEPYDHWTSTAWNGSMNFATYIIMLIAGVVCLAT